MSNKTSEWDKIEKSINQYMDSFTDITKSYSENAYLRESIGYLKGKCEAYERILLQHKLIKPNQTTPKHYFLKGK